MTLRYKDKTVFTQCSDTSGLGKIDKASSPTLDCNCGPLGSSSSWGKTIANKRSVFLLVAPAEIKTGHDKQTNKDVRRKHCER